MVLNPARYHFRLRRRASTQSPRTLFHTQSFTTTLSHTHKLVTHTHTIFHTQLCHTQLGHKQSFTQLCHTQIFHTQLRHKQSFTQLCHTHTNLSHTTLSHNLLDMCVPNVALADIHGAFARQAWHSRHWAGSWQRAWSPVVASGAAAVALTALGWVWLRAWSMLAGGAAALCVAGVALAYSHVTFAWQA